MADTRIHLNTDINLSLMNDNSLAVKVTLCKFLSECVKGLRSYRTRKILFTATCKAIHEINQSELKSNCQQNLT